MARSDAPPDVLVACGVSDGLRLAFCLSLRSGCELITGLHHVQLVIPEGTEDDAREFYSGVLGLQEVDKPTHLQPRGGCWFRSATLEVHLGVDPDFRPATKAHPAFLVDSLDHVGERLEEAGYEVDHDTQISGFDRFYSRDPFGNRLEFLEQVTGPESQ